ncbi:hypothetical protein JCM11251_000833 [Rhodosporidiobolus azoricus]
MATEPLPTSLQLYKPTQQEKDAYTYLFDKGDLPSLLSRLRPKLTPPPPSASPCIRPYLSNLPCFAPTADSEQLGVLTGDLAVPFFSHSSLPPLILGQVWQLADPENSGFLTPERFGVACRLIGHAQEKRKTGAPEVKVEWVGKPGPLPTFSNFPLPSHLQQQPAASPAPPTSPPPASRIQPQSTGNANASLTSIGAEDKAKYARVFAGANGGALTGLLDGEKARDIFIKSNLPYEVLGQVWTLADTHSRGSLDLTDFTIGLHLVHLLMDGSLSPAQLPAVLDPKLYAAAAGLNPPGAPGPARQSSLAAAPPAVASPAPQQQQQQGPWAVTPAEKAESDQWFDQLDTGKTGRLEGEVAVGFFGQSGLEVAKLAKVWDLSDLSNLGYLTKETFAIAMHLLKSAVVNPSAPLPDTLPAELVPPSFRGSGTVGSQASAIAMSGPQRDLLDLMGDDDAPSTSVPALQPQATGTLSPQPTGQAQAQGLNRYASPPPPTSPSGPVVPAGTARAISPQPTGGSAQGYSLQGTIFPQATGGSTSGTPAAGGFGNNFSPSSPSAPVPRVPAIPQQHLQQQQQQQLPKSGLATSSTFFDDNDDADLASSASALQSQATQLRSSAEQEEQRMEQQGKTRAQLEKEVDALNKEIEGLQGRISVAREAHERESERVDELRTRERDGKANLSRARQALIAAESDLSALRMSKTELEGEVLRDKEDLREVQRRVAHVEEEKRVLEGEVEKVKKELRGLKGRGAIARKQLQTVEAGREKLESELGRLNTEGLEESIEEQTTAAPVLHIPPQQQQEHAAAVPLPATPSTANVLSPAASVRSTNPFDRFTQPQQQQPRAVSPQPTGGSAQSTNPFAFASSAPVSPAPAAAVLTSDPTPALATATDAASPAQEASREVDQPEQEEGQGHESLPYAAAAALGTGAVAALSAGAGVVAHALGVDTKEDERKKDEGEKQEGETDPFGVPVASSSSSSAAAVAPAPASDGFDDAFGAPSSFSPAASVDAAGPAQGEDAAAFDDAFTDFPPSISDTATPAPAAAEVEAADAPVQGTLGAIEPEAGFDDAFRDLTQAERGADEEGRVGKDAVEGTLGEVEPDAGFDEAFKEVSEHHQPAATAAIADKERPEDDSSDDEDEEGPEDVFASTASSARGRFDRSPSPTPSSNAGIEPIQAAEEDLARGGGVEQPQEVEEGGLKSREPTNASSESGESFVHVDAPTSSSSPLATSSFAATAVDLPPPGLNVVEGAHGFDPVVGPAGTEESKTMLEEPAPVGFEPASPAPLTPSSATTPATPALESPTEEKKEKRRAAPPPPTRSPASISTTGIPVPPAAAVEQGGFASAIPEPAAAAPGAVDDFESSFADMGPSSSTVGSTATAPQGTTDFDESAFDFQPDFADSLPATMTAATDTFDDAAFEDFDSSFPAVSQVSAAPAPAASSEAAFDDAFSSFPPASGNGGGGVAESFGPAGAPHLGPPVSTDTAVGGATSPFDTDAPALPARGASSASPLPPTPRDEQVELDGAALGRADNVGAVGNLMALGFKREQAVEALQKYDYDLERAANYLVTQAAQ